MSNISTISPVVDIADTRTHHGIDGGFLDRDIDEIGPTGWLAELAVERGEVVWYEAFDDDDTLKEWPANVAHMYLVALPEGHIFGRLEDVQVWGALPEALPSVPGLWGELQATLAAEWCARKLGLPEGTWSVAAEQPYLDRGVDVGWREVHIPPDAALDLEESGFPLARFAPHRYDRELWTAPNAIGVAERILVLEHEAQLEDLHD